MKFWYFSDMVTLDHSNTAIPVWNLYGEEQAFPDVLHVERITDRAAGLDWRISPHRHMNLHQIFLIRSGNVRMSVDGAPLALTAPCVMTIPPGTVHGFTFSAHTDGYVITIPLECLPELFTPDNGATSSIRQFAHFPAPASVEDIATTLHREHDGLGKARTLMLQALAQQLICEIIRHMPSTAPHTPRARSDRFQRFEALVHAHFREHWSIERYAQALNLSPRHLGRLCQQATGQSPAEYVETILIREACRLLAYTRAGIAEAGYQIGFDDPSYFSRVFRRCTGRTPREYRSAFSQE